MTFDPDNTKVIPPELLEKPIRKGDNQPVTPNEEDQNVRVVDLVEAERLVRKKLKEMAAAGNEDARKKLHKMNLSERPVRKGTIKPMPDEDLDVKIFKPGEVGEILKKKGQ